MKKLRQFIYSSLLKTQEEKFMEIRVKKNVHQMV